MLWKDPKGREWQVEADSEVITLRSGSDVLRVDRPAWGRDLQVSVVGDHLVVRVSGPDGDVGFLVPRAQAGEFLSRIGAGWPADTGAQARTAAAPRRGDPLWPKMTHGAVWALICSVLAFLPALGLGLGLAAIVLIVASRLRSRNVAAMAHARAMCRVALILATIGMGISLLAVYSFMQPRAEYGDDWGDRMVTDGMSYSYGAIAAAILIVLLSLSIHECGHAITAWWCGDDLARSLGRVTLNPLAHIDLFGTIILPAILAIAHAPVFGYAKPVPVRLGGVRRHHRAHILISLAGPGANLLLSAIALALLLALGSLLTLFAGDAEISGFSAMFSPVVISGVPGQRLWASAATVLKLTFMINVFLAGFNLIPIPPLDGSWILEHLFPGTLGRFYAAVRPYGILVFLVLFWADAFSYLLIPVAVPLGLGYAIVALCTGL